MHCFTSHEKTQRAILFIHKEKKEQYFLIVHDGEEYNVPTISH